MLRVTKDGKAKYQSLGISVNSKRWNFKKNEPKPKCPNFEQIQKIILDKKLEVQKKIARNACRPERLFRLYLINKSYSEVLANKGEYRLVVDLLSKEGISSYEMPIRIE